ncbi:hypothetical protein OHA18_06055 [Kribbella sp. NBC_00709]|uniref:hypothetical protein n=1 Tax=Kribbella sp. NBC_00709 TaxID=2975972 RepID=UPI002E2A64A8|nr:hypothetical protein [Kribbella sp. NBC_00709]
MDFRAAAVELYGLTPEQFTPARNDLAKAANAAGDPHTATALKALRKPTLAAWLANLLVRVDPDGVNSLTELGEQLRQAHLSADGPRLRQLTPRRHSLIAQLVKTARARAQRLHHPVSAQTADKLTETLDAALIDPGAAQLLRTGQLTSALQHVGFGVVDETGQPAQLAPIKPRVVRSTRTKPPTQRRPPADDPAKRRRAELESHARQADADYTQAEALRLQAEAELDAHEHLEADLRTTIERLTEELEHAHHQLREAGRHTRHLQRERDRTTRQAAVAQRRRDTNHQRLKTLDG